MRKIHHSAAGSLVILDGLDLVVPAGEFLAVRGPSGSGKTTLLNCLAGLDSLDDGQALINGVDWATMGDHQRSAVRAQSTGYVFQSFNLIPVLTAQQNVALPLRIGGASDREARRRAREELDHVGLGDRREHLPAALSGGEQQRVAVARATVTRPSIIWADEPTGNLDSVSAASVMALLHGAHATGVTIVLVTHERDVATVAQRRIELHDGRIVADDADPAES